MTATSPVAPARIAASVPWPPSSSDGTNATTSSPSSRASDPVTRERPHRAEDRGARRPSCRTAPRPYSVAVADLAAPGVRGPGRGVARRHDVDVPDEDEPPAARPPEPPDDDRQRRPRHLLAGPVRVRRGSSAGSGLEHLDGQPERRRAGPRARAWIALLVAGDARDPDERREVRDERRRRPRPPAAARAAGRRRGSCAQDRAGQAGRRRRSRSRRPRRAGCAWTSTPAASSRGARDGVALGDDRRRPAGPRARCSRASAYSSSGTSTSRIPRSASSSYRPAGRSGRNTTARSSATGEITESRWTSSAGPFQYGTSKTRTSPPTIAASWRAPASFVRSVRPMHSRSGPEPERVAALERARRLDPAERRDAARPRPRLEDAGSPARFGLPGPERDRAAVGDEQRVEDVDEVRVVGLGVEDVDRRARGGSASRRGRRARAGPARGPRGAGSRAPGRRRRAPNAGPGAFTSTSRSGAVMLWAPQRAVGRLGHRRRGYVARGLARRVDRAARRGHHVPRGVPSRRPRAGVHR